MEVGWPYAQDAVFARLLSLVKPGGHLLFVGLEPYELLPGSKPSDAVRRFEAVGDAAALLAGTSSYREMPQEWVMRQLERNGEYQVASSMQFPSMLGPGYARSQLDFAQSQASNLGASEIRRAILGRVKAMRSESESFSAKGQNYAVVATRRVVSARK